MRNFAKLSGAVVLGIWLSAMMVFPFSVGMAKESGSEAKGGQDEISFYQLEEQFMVTATKRKTSVRNAPAIATVITAAEIKGMGARDLSDVLKMVPGFGVSKPASNGYMFEVRGIRTSYSEKILVMMDGHRINESYDGSALSYQFTNLPVDKVRQIEIIRGPGSALYGANAFVAVINIITKEAEDVDGIEAKVAGGNFDTKKVSILGGKAFKDKDFKIFGSADYTKTDGDEPTIKADMLSGTPFSKTPGNADTHLEQEDAFLKASYGDLILRGHFLRRDVGSYIGFANTLSTGSTFKHNTFWSDLSYAKSFTDKFSTSFRAYFDYWDSDADLRLFPPGFPPGFTDGMIGRPATKNRTLGTELQFNYNFFEKNHVIAGFCFDQTEQYDTRHVTNFNPWTSAPLGSIQDITSWANFNKDVTRKVWAAYLQDEWAILENLNLTAGVRHDQYDDFGGTTNPRIGLVWNFLKDADMKVLYGQAFRAPSLVELYNDSNPSVVGNPNLKPETIKTYEADLGYRFGGAYSINANYFRNEIADLILVDYSKALPIYMNRGGAKIDGVEVVLMGKYSPVNYWKLNFTWQKPKDADTDQDLPNVPSQRASFSVNWELFKYLDAHTDVLWTGSRPRVSGDSRGDMSAYTTVDLTLIGKNFCKNIEVRGIIHNLFDTKYEDPDLSGAQKLIPFDYPREGISAMLEVGYKF